MSIVAVGFFVEHVSTCFETEAAGHVENVPHEERASLDVVALSTNF